MQLEDVRPKRGATTLRVDACTGKYFDHRRRTEVNCKRSSGPERGGWDVSSGRWRGCEASGGTGWHWSETDDKFLAPSHCVHTYLVPPDEEMPTEDVGQGDPLQYSAATMEALTHLLTQIDRATSTLSSTLTPESYAALAALPLSYPWST